MQKEPRAIIKICSTVVGLVGALTALTGVIGRNLTSNHEGDDKKTELYQTFSDVAIAGFAVNVIGLATYQLVQNNEIQNLKRKEQDIDRDKDM